MVNIKLQSSDGDVFEIDADIAKCFGLIKDMLDTYGEHEDNDELLPIPILNSFILKRVIEWAIRHKDDPPLPEFEMNVSRRANDISSWDAAFLNKDRGGIVELANAAHYLDVRGLYDVACKFIANLIKGKSREQFRKLRIKWQT